MATEFQTINKVAQAAVSSSKEFLETLDYRKDGDAGSFDQDELDNWLTFTFEELGFPEEVRGLYDDVLTASVNAYMILTGIEDED